MIAHFARLATAMTLALAASGTHAQVFPSKPITLIVPFSPGASADGISRIVGKELSIALGQAVVIENKPGAGGALGLIALSKAPADGYTLGLGATGAIAVNPHLPDAPPLKPQKDLTPIAKLADIPLVFVTGPNSGYGNLQAFIKKSRATKGGLTFGTPGQYTSQHLSGELLAAITNIEMQAVPYRGSAPAVTDLLGGMLPGAVVDLTSAYPHIKAGKLVALGVTSAKRSKVAPEIPTIAEEGVAGYAAPAWMGFFAPANLPPGVTTKLSQSIKAIMAKPEVQEQIIRLAAEPVYLDSAQFGDFISTESKKWAAVIAKMPAPKK
ncbi:MAG: tripartite tricarboxylate transporter substrate binding protein [Burkholderiaceae bacterium]|nr:tripartite tricarboxylate transporter substrate binding protein [Burkholderiaceae bacterium]